MTINDAALTLCGEPMPCGSYVLQIRVNAPIHVRFGAFRQGTPVPIAAGYLVYIGSAMGQTGSATLSRRLLRHATRTGSAPAHPLQAALIEHFGKNPPQRKQLRWHIDYLLEMPETDLIGGIAVQSANRLEAALAALIDENPETAPLAPGLGAGDHPGATHLVRYTGPVHRQRAWWQEIINRACAQAAPEKTTV